MTLGIKLFLSLFILDFMHLYEGSKLRVKTALYNIPFSVKIAGVVNFVQGGRRVANDFLGYLRYSLQSLSVWRDYLL